MCAKVLARPQTEGASCFPFQFSLGCHYSPLSWRAGCPPYLDTPDWIAPLTWIPPCSDSSPLDTPLLGYAPCLDTKKSVLRFVYMNKRTLGETTNRHAQYLHAPTYLQYVMACAWHDACKQNDSLSQTHCHFGSRSVSFLQGE